MICFLKSLMVTFLLLLIFLIKHWWQITHLCQNQNFLLGKFQNFPLEFSSNSMWVGVGTLFKSQCKAQVNRRVSSFLVAVACGSGLFQGLVGINAVMLLTHEPLRPSHLTVSHVRIPAVMYFQFTCSVIWGLP